MKQIMKINVPLCGILCSLLFSVAIMSSCTKGEGFPMGAVKFNGEIEDLATRTSLDPTEGGYNLNWVKNDLISVTDGVKTYRYFAVKGGSTSTTFAPVLPVNGGTEGMDVDAEEIVLTKAPVLGQYTAYYPASLIDGTLPAKQDYMEGNIKDAPMMAGNSASPTTFRFRQLCGILKLNVSTSQPNIKVRSITVSADQGMSGKYTMIDGVAVVHGEGRLSLDCGEDGVAIGHTPTAFHISVPSNRYTGLVIRILTTDNTMSIIRLQAGTTYTVRRAELREINLAADNFGEPSWTDGKAVLCTGGNFNEILKQLTRPGSYQQDSDNAIKKIIFQTGILSTEGIHIEDATSEVPIYLYFDKASGVAYVNTPASSMYTNEQGNAMFDNLRMLERIENFSALETGKSVSFFKLFNNCSRLSYCDLSNMSSESLKDGRYMFYGCSSLKEVNLHNCTFEKIVSMQSMFTSMTSLQKLDLSSWDVRSLVDVAAVEKLFYGLKSLTEVRFGADGYNDTSFRPSSFWCASSDAYSSRPGSKTGTLTIYCSEAGATWLANTNLRWVHSGYSGKTPVSVKFYDWQDNTKEYTPVWAAD